MAVREFGIRYYNEVRDSKNSIHVHRCLSRLLSQETHKYSRRSASILAYLCTSRSSFEQWISGSIMAPHSFPECQFKTKWTGRRVG